MAMHKEMIILTGGAGFIGSAFLWKLNQLGEERVLVVDELGKSEKWKNLVGLRFYDYLEKDVFLERWGRKDFGSVKAFVHLGACSSTTEKDASYLVRNNYEYSKQVFHICHEQNIPFYYASSAATYGDGAQGFVDDEEALDKLRPLNMYALSKQMFDLYLRRQGWLKDVVCWKFFNVYGANEYHKGEMRSVIHKAYYQIKETGSVKLFKSYRADFADGEQQRDFLYVKDCVKMMAFFMEHKQAKGVFNLGTGQERSWNDLAKSVFAALKLPPKIEYIEMPEKLKPKYQYYTCAPIQKLKRAGYKEKLFSLESGIKDYVCEYLEKGRWLGS